jgi:hypothetical protein
MQVFESLFLPINIKYFDLFMHQATIGHIHHVLHGGRVVGVLTEVAEFCQREMITELNVFH